MRAYILFAFLAVATAATLKDQTRAFEETIENFLECLRGEMQNGWPDQGIPGLDPLEISELTLDITSLGLDGIRGELTVQDLVFHGLPDYEYENIKGSIGLLPPSYTVSLDLNFPNPILNTKYSGNVQIDALELDTFGTGELSFNANNFRANVGLKAQILGGIKLDYLDIWVSMDPLTAFEITGLRDDPDYSAQISEEFLTNGVQKLEELSPTIHDMAESVLMDTINNGDLGEEGGFLSGIIDRCLF